MIYYKNKLVLFFFLALSLSIYAQKPVVKLDINIANRSNNEVNEPDYVPWVPANEQTTSITQEGVTFTFTKIGEVGQALRDNWYKAGIQAPYYARLGCDGVYVDGGDAGAQIELRISGLNTGTHTLMTFHNALTSKQCSPMDILLNGTLVTDDLNIPLRATTRKDLAVNYISFDAVSGTDTVLLFRAETSTSDEVKNVYICGIELNTPNFKNQSKEPSPEDKAEHDVDPGTVNMTWVSASNATVHHVYFGQNESAVSTADPSSAQYKGSQSSTEFSENGLSSHKMYYWRVDEETAEGVVTKGKVWSFRPRQLAFPDAEGYGRYAIGGRGGKVVHVTNLEDAGPGSLRDAVENQTGPRTIVFDVAGIITLRARLVLSDPKVTVAGQTAPGKGICIRAAPFGFTGNDVIARFMRLRLGAGTTYDGMGLTGANYSILDHASISWTIDEGFSSRGAHHITLQRTLISEALNIAGHQNYPEGTKHGYAATIGGDIGSFHYNLLAHNYGRNWSLGGGLDGDGYYAGRLDITNNVVYNWGHRTTDGGAHEVNFVNNYYKPGAATDLFYALTMEHEGVGKGSQRAYFSGNVMPGYFDETNQESGRRSRITNNEIVDYETFVDDPFFPSYVNTISAEEAYKNVLSDVGANQPVFDDHDIRMVEETLNGTYTYTGSKSGLPGLPDTQEDVGGYEDYPVEQRAEDWDTDGDGLPNWWEQLHGTNEKSPSGDYSDSNADKDMDGYTSLEDYLEWMAHVHYMNSYGNEVIINLTDLFKGYTSDPSYSVASVNGGEVNISGSTATFTPQECGMASFQLNVADSQGSTMSRKVSVYTESEIPGNCLCNCETGILEAENGCTIGNAEPKSENEGFSGEGYLQLTNAEESSITWSVDSKLDQTVNLAFRFANGSGTQKTSTVQINGKDQGDALIFPATESLSDWNSANLSVSLKKGNNEIKLITSGNEELINLDLIYLPEGVAASSCELLGFESPKADSGTYVYPNPTSSKVFWEKNQSWTLYSIGGLKLREGNGKSLDMSTFKSGVYVIKFDNKRNLKIIKK